jgi:6-phosphogluconolactonase
MRMPIEHFYSNRQQLIDTLLSRIVAVLNDAIAQRGRASLLVSGGRSPECLYRALAQMDIEWPRVTIALVDERWVDTQSAASNEYFIRNTLLQGAASRAVFIPMKNAEATADKACQTIEKAYSHLIRPFDFCVLGMGNDGHTASLFPYAQGLAAAMEPATATMAFAIVANSSAVTGQYTERTTLGLSALLSCRELALLINGEEKLAVYRQALLCRDFLAMPVSALLQGPVPVHVYWSP